jgi:hypothetical protein
VTLRYVAFVQQRPPVWLAPARGSLLGGLTTLLTATGHIVGGASVQHLSPLVVLVPLLVTVLVAVADRCRGIVAVLTTLGVGQAVLHQLLTVLAAHDHAVGTAALPGAAMVTAHAVATLVTAVVVSHADTAVAALVATLRRVLPHRTRPAVVDVAPPTRPMPSADVPLLAALGLVAGHSRRGPPATC